MIDFTNLPTRNKLYAGANGAKRAVIYQNEQYILKFPTAAPKNKDLSYSNSCITEYIGCYIFNSIGIHAQETLLGVYQKNGVERIVVACKDLQTRKERILGFSMEKLRKREKKRQLDGRE